LKDKERKMRMRWTRTGKRGREIWSKKKTRLTTRSIEMRRRKGSRINYGNEE
jgi:hypothetical protein